MNERKKYKESIISLTLVVVLIFTSINWSGITVSAENTNQENEDEREMPCNPERPSSRRDEWSGDYVYFGNWKKDYSDRKAIKWKVLNNDGKNMLLMSDESVDSRPYRAYDDYVSDADYTDERENTWEKSSIRKWLNDEFYNNAFTEEEQTYLATNTVLNGYSADRDYDSGPTTYDKVYLLSNKELSKSSYGFYGSGGWAVSRQFIETKTSGSYYSEIWTRTMATVEMVQGVGNPYAYWISKKGEFIRRGAFMASPASWDKNVHPVIMIPLDCPYWSNEEPVEADDSNGNSEDSTGNETSKWKDFKLKGLDFDITVPDGIPAIGGSAINMDFERLSIEFDMKDTEHGSEFRAVIGLKSDEQKEESKKELCDLEEDEWDGVKKWAESLDKNFLKGNLALMDVRSKVNSRIKEGKSAIGSVGSATSSKVDASVSGFVEGTIENGNVRSIGGGIWLKMSFKIGKQWQCWIVHLPVVCKFELGLGLDEKLSVGVDINAAEFYNKGDLEIEFPAIKVSGGVGIAYIADVSLYGSAKNVIEMKAGTSGHFDKEHFTETTDRDNLTATISGEIGVSASALCFSVEENLFDLLGIDAKWEYWNEKKGGLQLSKKKLKTLSVESRKKTLKIPANTYQLNRTDFAKQSPWYTETAAKTSKRRKGIATQSNTTVLQSGIYSAPSVKMATTDDGTTMMVYVADIEGRTAGNHTAVVYSIYDSTSQTWSTPQILEDDGTADFYPDIIANGSDIYVAWTDCKRRDFSEDVSLPEMAASCEISVAKYNAESAGFSVNSLTSNETVDIKPVFGKLKDQIGLIWLNNSKNDVLELKGTNSIQYSLCNQGEWSGTVSHVSCKDKVINSYSIGTLKEESYIAYITEPESEQDGAKLYAGKLGEEASVFDTTIKPEQGVQFATINGLSLLTWYGDGTLAYSSNLKNDYSLFQNTKFSSEYQIVTAGKTSALLFRACDQTAQQDSTDVYMCLSKNGSYFSQPVKITEDGKYVGSYTLSIKNGEYHLVYSRDNVTIQEEDIQKQTDLCRKIIAPYHSLSLEKVSYRETEIKPGGELSLYTVIKNNGLADEKKFHALVKCGEQILFDKNVNCDVEMGLDADATIKVSLPENISKDDMIQVIINPVGAENATNTKNMWEAKIGRSDLALHVEMDDNKKEVMIKTTNDSAVATNATLFVRDTDETGEIIQEFDLGEISSGGEVGTSISYDTILDGKAGMPVYFEVASEGEEVYKTNNFSYRYLEKDSNVALPSKGSQLGDVYQDGKIDGKDVSLLLQYRLKKRELTEEQIAAGDVYADGKIDGKDVSKLLQYRLGKISSLE